MKYSLFAFLSYLTLPAIALAGGSEGFVPLVGIPGLTGLPTFDDYVDALYALAISVAALIAVIQIVIGGAQYMMDDLITSKSAAKERIKNALIGLLIIIAAALILTTINSNLTRLDITAPAIGVDNSRPTQELSLEEALRRGFCDAGNGCQTYACNSAFMAAIDTNPTATCQQRCASQNGNYAERVAMPRAGGGTINTSVCAFSNNQISDLVTDMLQEAITENCPAGETCYAESCDNYGTEYRSYSCSGACTDGLIGSGLGGVYYDSVTNSCVFVGSTSNDTTMPCQYQGCQRERNECAADGGYVSNATEAPLQIRCRVPERQDPRCPAGQTLQEVEVCDGMSGFCSTGLECR